MNVNSTLELAEPDQMLPAPISIGLPFTSVRSNSVPVENEGSFFKELKEGQRRAFREIRSFVYDRNREADWEMLLEGGAGTGKTFLQKALVFDIPVNWCCTALTNQAAKVLQANVGENATCRTVYSVFGIQMTPREDLLELKYPATPVDLTKYDVITVDEAGMTNKALCKYIRFVCRMQGIKLLWVGDRAQLNPVGEGISTVFKTRRRVALKKVLRHDNQILQFALHVREQVLSYPESRVKLRSNNDGRQGVWKLKTSNYYDQIEAAAAEGMFTRPNDTKVIAWRRKSVELANRLIRKTIYGRDASKEMWLPGDRIAVREPVHSREDGSVVLAHVEDEGSILSSVLTKSTKYPNLMCYRTAVKIDDGQAITLDILTERSQPVYEDELNRLARIAKNDTKQWKAFWALKKSFHNVLHSYAKTAHRAQGSTYTNVFADATEILSNPDEEEALRCFYVTATRPTTRLIMI